MKNGEHCDKFVMGVQNPEKDSIVWVSISTAPIYDEDDITPSRGYTIFEDVTDKINAGKKIQQLNNSLIAAQEMVKLGYWSYNLKSKSARWSDQMYTILGLDKKNGIPNIGKNDNLIDNDYRMAFNEAVHLCLKGEQCKLTVKVTYPDKSIHYVLSQGFPRYNDHNELIEILGTSQDITELKKK